MEREKLSVHLYDVFLTNSLVFVGFGDQISVSKGQTDHFSGQHLLVVFPVVTKTELGASLFS